MKFTDRELGIKTIIPKELSTERLDALRNSNNLVIQELLAHIDFLEKQIVVEQREAEKTENRLKAQKDRILGKVGSIDF
jgi:hypothetical protein